ncbi:MAG: hypothetical protein RLZZ450_4676 [Pseudomonadota bacterium]|jgi:hypothetical protein
MPTSSFASDTYVLHILTHGRRYSEEYDDLEQAIDAALALEHEPRERAESITKAGVVCVDREQLSELARTRG